MKIPVVGEIECEEGRKLRSGKFIFIFDLVEADGKEEFEFKILPGYAIGETGLSVNKMFDGE